MNVKRTTLLISALVIGLPVLAVSGQEPGQKNEGKGCSKRRAPGPPEVMEILRKADEATRAVKAVSYEAEFYGEGVLADRVSRITGTLKAKQRRRSLLGRLLGGSNKTNRMRIEGKLIEPGSNQAKPFKVATDGTRVCRINEDKKILIQGEAPTAHSLLGKHGRHPLFMVEYLYPTPFSDEIHGRVARREGVEEIGGVKCDVIYIVYADRSESRWYFGQEDHLPRRVDRIEKKGGSEGAYVRVLTEVNTEPVFKTDDFRLACPEGYEIVQCKDYQRRIWTAKKAKRKTATGKPGG